MPNRIPIDPKLPARFNDTPNEERSKAQLDAWWDHPYGVTREDGTIDVLCLNGGAWDRSTWLGNAPDRDQADKLAEEKQVAWLKFRNRPALFMWGAGEKHQIVLMPQRPDEQQRVLAVVDTPEQGDDWMREHYPEADVERRQ